MSSAFPCCRLAPPRRPHRSSAACSAPCRRVMAEAAGIRRRRRALASSAADIKPIPNDPVAGLIDIPLPREVGLWPQTWEARIATMGLLAAAIVLLGQFVHRRHANRYRREALAELKRIERIDG